MARKTRTEETMETHSEALVPGGRKPRKPNPQRAVASEDLRVLVARANTIIAEQQRVRAEALRELVRRETAGIRQQLKDLRGATAEE